MTEDRQSISSEHIDDALAEQMRLQKLLERQQRILKASNLLPDISTCYSTGNNSLKSHASEVLIEDILNLSIFKQFLINQEHVAL